MSKYRNDSLLWLLNYMVNFNSIPPAGDYLNYGKSLLICCKGDGNIAAAERAFVISYFAAFGFPDDVLDTLATYDGTGDLKAILSSSSQLQMNSKAAIWDAVRASNVDGDLAVGEVEVIKNIAKMLNISASEVDDIISIYHAEEAIKATRLQITYPNGSPY